MTKKFNQMQWFIEQGLQSPEPNAGGPPMGQPDAPGDPMGGMSDMNPNQLEPNQMTAEPQDDLSNDPTYPDMPEEQEDDDFEKLFEYVIEL